MADIAKVLRMSPANVYRFFDSKKAINEAVAERLMGEVEAALEAIADRRVPAGERLRALAECLHHMNAERYTANLRMHEMVEARVDGKLERHPRPYRAGQRHLSPRRRRRGRSRASSRCRTSTSRRDACASR